jgi:hypothetical protein
MVCSNGFCSRLECWQGRLFFQNAVISDRPSVYMVLTALMSAFLGSDEQMRCWGTLSAMAGRPWKSDIQAVKSRNIGTPK